jgi:tRNA threonylcarbamoyladenosine biosynthesis protein TsaE
MKFQCETPEETFKLGQQLGKQLVPSDIVLLYGDLGAGKTTLIQGICNGLELAPELPVRSPTFTLINEYQAKHSIYHIDLYRLETMVEIENLGLEEYLYGDGITLIEWAEKLGVPRALQDQNPLEKNTSATQKPPLHAPNPFHISAHLEIEITPISNDLRHFNIQSIGLSQREWPNSTLQ